MKIVHPVRLTLAAQAQAYVEYRMFSAISRFGRDCVRLSIRLEESDSTSRGDRYRCHVTLYLTPSGRIRVRATGDRLYSAIDAAAARLARGVESRLGAQSLGLSRGVANAVPQGAGRSGS